ncbi:MAG: hypothetical protein ISP90_09895 [Nevskia sp.]|nr:hypothetical protein [Nevskia sp.]
MNTPRYYPAQPIEGVPACIRYARISKWPRYVAAAIAGVASCRLLGTAIYDNLDALDPWLRWGLAIAGAPVGILILLRFSHWDSYPDRRRASVYQHKKSSDAAILDFIERRKNDESPRTMRIKFWRLFRDRYTGAMLYSIAAYPALHTEPITDGRRYLGYALCALALASAQELFYVALLAFLGYRLYDWAFAAVAG